MSSELKNFLFIFLFLASFISVKSQTCSYDGNAYSTSTTVSISETTAGTCKESYAISTDVTKDTVLTFSNIVIDCASGTNDITLTTTAETYRYCSSNPGTFFIYVAKQQNFVSIRKLGVMSFTLNIGFVSNATPCVSYNPCQNGGSCTATSSTAYTCACTSGFSGTNCQTAISTTPNVRCNYDGTAWTSDTSVSVSETQANACKESFAISLDTTKDIALVFSNMVIDCTNSNNNLKVVGVSSSFLYCGNSTSTSFTHVVSRESYVSVQKYGTVSFNLNIIFATNYDVCSSSPCKNGGTCTVSGTSSFTCACTTSWGGSTCESEISVPSSVRCAYDGVAYTSATTATISETQTNACKESYAILTGANQMISLTLSNIVIDCTNTNNELRLSDITQSYIYCGNSTTNTFVFTSRQNYVSIQKYGTLQYTMALTFS